MTARFGRDLGVLEVEHSIREIAVEELRLATGPLSHEAVVLGIMLNGHEGSNRYGQHM